MSIIPPGLSRLLQFYLSGPMPCPYLPGRVERKLFTRLSGDRDTDAEVNAAMTRAGFRRSHDIVYRPACVECNACVPVRVPVRVFAPSRGLRRIAAANRDLSLEIVGPQVTPEHYDLFMAYQRARHPDSDMATMTAAEFAQMLSEGESKTYIYQLRDPAEARRSLGAQLILSLIDEARRQNLAHVYLGYWIAAARKMAYKARFRPLQALGPQGWDWLDLTDAP